jgi:hypothetical protein
MKIDSPLVSTILIGSIFLGIVMLLSKCDVDRLDCNRNGGFYFKGKCFVEGKELK